MARRQGQRLIRHQTRWCWADGRLSAFVPTRWAVPAVNCLVAICLISAVTVSALRHSGTPSSQLDLTAGSAWFVDQGAGSVSLFDAATATRVTMLQVAGRSVDIEAVQSATQSGSGAYVLNYNTGQITHIDGATLTAGTPQSASSRQDPRLAIATTLKRRGFCRAGVPWLRRSTRPGWPRWAATCRSNLRRRR
jgi:hypothetical protein